MEYAMIKAEIAIEFFSVDLFSYHVYKTDTFLENRICSRDDTECWDIQRMQYEFGLQASDGQVFTR
jgi:hypothetical protein